MAVLEDHADRAGDGAFARHDMVGGDRGHIGGGRAEPVDHGDDRLRLRRPADGAVERFAAACRAAAGIDVEHDRLDRARLGRPVDHLDRGRPRQDEAVDLDVGDLPAAGARLQALEVRRDARRRRRSPPRGSRRPSPARSLRAASGAGVPRSFPHPWHGLQISTASKSDALDRLAMMAPMWRRKSLSLLAVCCRSVAGEH